MQEFELMNNICLNIDQEMHVESENIFQNFDMSIESKDKNEIEDYK